MKKGIIVFGVAAASIIGAYALYISSAGSACRSLSNSEATQTAVEALHQSFGTEPDFLLGGMTAKDVRVAQVSREVFEGSDALSRTNVHFSSAGDGREVVIAEIYWDCDLEWRAVNPKG